jgi:hypothetical protein
MKKTYMQPQVAVVKVELRSAMLTTSNMKLDRNESNKLTDSNDILTKDQGDWDEWDDWDE